MIKMNYGTKKHQKQLENDFKALIDDTAARQKEWVKLRKKLYKLNQELKDLLPTQMKEIMVLPYHHLADIYKMYIELNVSKINSELHNDLAALFNYDNKKKKFTPLSQAIIEFFTNPNNGFDIHTCPYCDMSYINYFNTSKKNRTQFDLDHVLNKASCPIVALCLYNLVPCCTTCNGPHIKGKRKMEATLAQLKKLSPSSNDYDFENKVNLWIRPKSKEFHNTNMLKYQDEFEIDFDTSQDKDYDIEIDFFFLRERYNYHKCEALRLADLKARYTPAKIKEMAKIICNQGTDESKGTTPYSLSIIEQIRSDIFNDGFSKQYHRTFNKLRDDIINSKVEK